MASLCRNANGSEVFFLATHNSQLTTLEGAGGSTFVIEILEAGSYRNYKYSGIETNDGENYRRLEKFNSLLLEEFGIDLTMYRDPV